MGEAEAAVLAVVRPLAVVVAESSSSMLPC